jgi:sigma-54 dependent transcriptional regulator, acetoin dehydrogenase operon transcriptional activator AcoR
VSTLTDRLPAIMQYFTMSDVTLSTLSHSEARPDGDDLVADEIVVLLECDRPSASSARHRLVDIDEVVIGRGSTRNVERSGRSLSLRLPDARVSTVHATLRRDGLAFVILDEGSKNGITVNGRRVERQLLSDGDMIECGRTFLLFRMARSRPRDEPLDLDAAALAPAAPGLATFHQPLAAQFRALAEVARTSLPVLILGASGTGKELVSRSVHALSQRRGAFVGVNCGALPENLVEAELFGARRGAFTGASDDKPGLIRASDQGTLFLDEIGDLAPRAQPALLRILQEREVLAIGATRAVGVDLRVVAATHRDLDEMVRQEKFRADLLARVCGFVVRMPSLRERLEDFGLIVAGLLSRHGSARPTITVDAMRVLLRHPWPLNVRELEHAMRAALALSPSRIDVPHLPPAVREPPDAVGNAALPQRRQRMLTSEQLVRRDHLCALLEKHRGNISAVARDLGKDRVQIRRWIKQLEISVDELIA